MALGASQARVTAQFVKQKNPHIRSRSSSLGSLSYQSDRPPTRRKASASSLGSSGICEDSEGLIPRVSSENSVCNSSENLLRNSNSLESPNGGPESVTWLTPRSSISSSPARFSNSGSSERPHHNTPVRQLHNTDLTCVTELSRSPSPAEDIASIMDSSSDNVITSTPKEHLSVPQRPQRPLSLTPPRYEDSTAITHDFTTSHRTNETMLSVDIMPDDDMMNVPIIGYEVMEERARFTVYKIHVHKSKDENWFIFRRYSDFVRLNDQLAELFPHFRLALPPKKWFGDNFDYEFLDERMKGLQAFLRNVTSHREVACSEPIRTFLCVDDPPGPHESIEESRAQCDQLEEQVYDLRRENKEKDARIALLEEELALHKAEIENLRKSLRLERALNASRLRERKSPSQSSQRSECSLPEQDQTGLETEADQAMTSSMDSRCTGLVSELTNHILHTAMVHTSSEDIPNGQVNTGLPEKLASMEGNNNSQLHSPEGSMSSNDFSKSSLGGSHSPSTAAVS